MQTQTEPQSKLETFLCSWIPFLMTGHNRKMGTVFNRPRGAMPRSFTKRLTSSCFVNQAGQQAFETKDKRMTKCSPHPLSFSCSHVLSPLALQHVTKKKKKKLYIEGDGYKIWQCRKEKTLRGTFIIQLNEAKSYKTTKASYLKAVSRVAPSDQLWSSEEPYRNCHIFFILLNI